MHCNIQFVPGEKFPVPIKTSKPQSHSLRETESSPEPVPSPFEIVALIEDFTLPDTVKENLLRQKWERFCAAHWGQAVNLEPNCSN